LDQGQKSEGTRRYSRHRRHLLRGFPPFSVFLSPVRCGPKFFKKLVL
jgi:hypothetical protein